MYNLSTTQIYNKNQVKGKIWFNLSKKINKCSLYELCLNQISSLILNNTSAKINIPNTCLEDLYKLVEIKKFCDSYDIHKYSYLVFYTDDFYPNKRLIYLYYKNKHRNNLPELILNLKLTKQKDNHCIIN